MTAKRIEPSVLVGEVLTHIDTDGKEVIMLTTESGRVFRIYHEQDCCESVSIEDTQGNWHDLVGKVILEASQQEEEDPRDPPTNYTPAGYIPESSTRTTFTFRTNDATVISRWFGESNGYYSESVDLHEIVKDLCN